MCCDIVNMSTKIRQMRYDSKAREIVHAGWASHPQKHTACMSLIPFYLQLLYII